MSKSSVWCRICNRVVAVAVEEAGGALVAPIACAIGGGAIGAANDGSRGAMIGSVVGLLVGAAVRGLTHPVQRLVCGECHHQIA